MKKIIFASHNAHKTKEIAALLGGLVSVNSLSDIGFSQEIEENGISLEENALIKAKTIHNLTELNCFADDTGLFVDALNGEPGIYSARYAGEEKDSNLNIEKLLKKLEDIKNRKASFRTVICLILNQKVHYFIGELHGVIIHERRGIGGFGYDPVFIPDGFSNTLAEMDLTQKNTISHRAKAFLEMRKFFVENANC